MDGEGSRRAQKIHLAYRHAVMPKNVVGPCSMKIEVRQPETHKKG